MTSWDEEEDASEEAPEADELEEFGEAESDDI